MICKNTFSGVYYIMAKIRYNYDDNSGVSYASKKSRKSYWWICWLVVLFFVAWGIYAFCFGDREEKKTVDTPVKEPVKAVEQTQKTPEIKSQKKTPKVPDVPENTAAPAKVDGSLQPDAHDYPLGAVTLDKVPQLKNAENNKLFAKAVADTDYQTAKMLLLKELGECKNKTSLYFRTLGKYLRALNLKILFDGVPGGKNQNYIIKSGDSLIRIAVKHNLPVSAIVKANKLKSATIFPGQRLKIYCGKWRIEVSKLAKLLYVYDGNDLFAIYDIGIGKEGRTPVGDFILTDKIEHPAWYAPDGRIVPYGEKENVLGTHWLKIEPAGNTDRAFVGYGIHGTWDEGSITKSLSNGCIRMTNDEVAELFTYIPRKTAVKIY